MNKYIFLILMLIPTISSAYTSDDNVILLVKGSSKTAYDYFYPHTSWSLNTSTGKVVLGPISPDMYSGFKYEIMLTAYVCQNNQYVATDTKYAWRTGHETVQQTPTFCCPKNQDEVSGQCLDKCPDGQVRDNTGNCQVCPSGNFTLQNVCIPYCTHGTGQPIGSLYPHDTGVCVPPPCTEDENQVSAEPLLGDKCVPKCHLDRYNPTTGLCTEQCDEGEYSLTEDGECLDIPDCGPEQEWSNVSKECVDKPPCPVNQVRNPNTGQCECDEYSSEDPNDQTKCIKINPDEEIKPDETENNAPVEGNSNPGVIKDNPDLPTKDIDPGQGTAGDPHNPDSDGDGNPDGTNPDGEGNTDGTKTGYWGTAEKPVITNADHKWGVNKRMVDFKPLYDLTVEIKKTDIYKGIDNLNKIVQKMVAPGSAPQFNFTIGGSPLTIDLSVMNPAVDIIRGLLSILIWFGLIFVILKQWRWL